MPENVFEGLFWHSPERNTRANEKVFAIMEDEHMENNPSSAFWRHSVGYIIYPESFRDSNGDGIGDLGGIIPFA
jgi:hypothetical protein